MERQNVLASILKLMRAMRRHPPRPEHDFPPAVGRFLSLLSENNGASSREMCELLDIRPSSLSELLTRMERERLIERTVDENDRRGSRITLSDSGNEAVARMASRRDDEAERLSACFTDEEAAQFCALCDRLSAYLESLPREESERPRHPPFPHGSESEGWPRNDIPFDHPFPHRREAFFDPMRPEPRPFREPRILEPPQAPEDWNDDRFPPPGEGPRFQRHDRGYARGGIPPIPANDGFPAHGRPIPCGPADGPNKSPSDK